MLSVLRQYNLPLHFPKNALREAELIARSRVRRGQPRPPIWPGAWIAAAHPVVTIDPDDAKDFDDAICLERAGDGRWKVWVHIADVSHYVKPGGALDEEARRRGNSTYLVDRVIPMLPEALSNELCSLKPGMDRLTKCVEFLLSDEGRRAQRQILSRRHPLRAAASLTRKRWPSSQQPRRRAIPIERMLQQAHALAQTHPRAPASRPARWTWIFPTPKSGLTNRAALLRVERIENDVSHQLIEEFMLLANEAVAARLMALRRPAVYRVHEPPDERALAGIPPGRCQPSNPLRQSGPARRGAETHAPPQRPARRAGLENRLSQIAHARPLRRRTAGPLRTEQGQIHPFHLAHPPLRRPAGPPRAV